jgi:phosphoribosyl-ATP pyrophosphohydrolase/phosphoribosyl-AMP cyclohydrolase
VGRDVLDLSTLNFEKGNGLVTVVAQDARTGAVLMVAHADREALERTQATGEMHYRSRTRGLWHKGATSGAVQRVVSLSTDCDGDAVLARVTPAGAACHTGSMSCFGPVALAADSLGLLDATIARRAEGQAWGVATPPRAQHAVAQHGGAATAIAGTDTDTARFAASPPGSTPPRGTAPIPHGSALNSGQSAKPSYTQRLLTDRNLRLKKLGEEMAELVTACADADPARAVEEGADVLYHALVALRAIGVTLDDVRRELGRRTR